MNKDSANQALRRPKPSLLPRLLFVLSISVFFGACLRGGAVFPLAAAYPEGPLVDERRLLFAEMGADQVTEFDLASETRRVFWREKGCGPTSIAPFGDGYVVLCHLGNRLVFLDDEGRPLSKVTHDDAGAPLYHPNDSHGDGQGGVYFTLSGDFVPQSPAVGVVYHLSREGRARAVAKDLAYANGVLVVGGHTLFVSEHLAQRVRRYVIGDGGALTPDGFLVGADFWADARDPLRGPDGLAVGPDGSIYIADYGGGRVLAVTFDGHLKEEIKVPAPYVTNMAALPPSQRLFVTAAMDNRHPSLPGAVYQFDLSDGSP